MGLAPLGLARCAPARARNPISCGRGFGGGLALADNERGEATRFREHVEQHGNMITFLRNENLLDARVDNLILKSFLHPCAAFCIN